MKVSEQYDTWLYFTGDFSRNDCTPQMAYVVLFFIAKMVNHDPSHDCVPLVEAFECFMTNKLPGVIQEMAFADGALVVLRTIFAVMVWKMSSPCVCVCVCVCVLIHI